MAAAHAHTHTHTDKDSPRHTTEAVLRVGLWEEPPAPSRSLSQGKRCQQAPWHPQD